MVCDFATIVRVGVNRLSIMTRLYLDKLIGYKFILVKLGDDTGQNCKPIHTLIFYFAPAISTHSLISKIKGRTAHSDFAGRPSFVTRYITFRPLLTKGLA